MDGWPKVEKILQHIGAIETIGIDAATVALSIGAMSLTLPPAFIQL